MAAPPKPSAREDCNDPANQEECAAFGGGGGQDGGGETGPGGCTSEAECMAYCSDPANESECRAFAEAQGFDIPEGGPRTGPGGCTSEADVQRLLQRPQSRRRMRRWPTARRTRPLAWRRAAPPPEVLADGHLSWRILVPVSPTTLRAVSIRVARSPRCDCCAAGHLNDRPQPIPHRGAPCQTRPETRRRLPAHVVPQ